MKPRKARQVTLLCVTILVIASFRHRFVTRDHVSKKLYRRYSINHTAANQLRNDGCDRVVFYNRVGKCGSRSLLQVVKHLAKRNKFRVLSSHKYDDARIHPKDLYGQLASFGGYIPPLFYNRHIYFLDFQAAGIRPPYYINLIRDPIERFSSHYNFLKYGDKEGEVNGGSFSHMTNINKCVMDEVNPCNSDLMVYTMNYFCGHNCQRKHGSAGVTIAKKHIDDYYVFVGLLEDFEASLLLLEVLLPCYFRGAIDAWEIERERSQSYATVKKDELTNEAKDKLRRRLLKTEYDIYSHVKEKFDQLKNLYLIER